MTLPVSPDVETVLRSCAATIRDVLLPELESEWGRYSASLCAASLEYALGQLGEDRNGDRRAELAGAIDALRVGIEADGDDAMRAALRNESPYEAASALLVAAQNADGALAERVRAGLHPVLHAQLDRELGHAMPLFIAFAKNIQGAS